VHFGDHSVGALIAQRSLDDCGPVRPLIHDRWCRK
jgi:hypothetical protein